MRIFGNRSPKVRLISETSTKRVLDFSDFIEDKISAKNYAKEFAHVAPDRVEFMDRVKLWESNYVPFRESQGWKIIKGGRNSDDRFRIYWQVGEQIIVSSQDDWTGLITEKPIKERR